MIPGSDTSSLEAERPTSPGEVSTLCGCALNGVLYVAVDLATKVREPHLWLPAGTRGAFSMRKRAVTVDKQRVHVRFGSGAVAAETSAISSVRLATLTLWRCERRRDLVWCEGSRMTRCLCCVLSTTALLFVACLVRCVWVEHSQ